MVTNDMIRQWFPNLSLQAGYAIFVEYATILNRLEEWPTAELVMERGKMERTYPRMAADVDYRRATREPILSNGNLARD